MASRAGSSALRYLLGGLLAFGAINAFGGGYYGLSGAEGVPTEWLEGSPFSDYFIPSLVLFTVVGGSFLFAAIAVFSGSVSPAPALSLRVPSSSPGSPCNWPSSAMFHGCSRRQQSEDYLSSRWRGGFRRVRREMGSMVHVPIAPIALRITPPASGAVATGRPPLATATTPTTTHTAAASAKE